MSERVTVSGAAPDIEAAPSAATTSLSQAEIQTRLPSNLVQTLENVRRRESGQRRPGGRAGTARPVERPHPHPHRRRTRELRAAGRRQRDLPRSRHPRRRRSGARPRLGGLRVGCLRRRDCRHHAESGARSAPRRACRRARSAPACPKTASAATCRRALARAASSSPPTLATPTTGTARRATTLNSGYTDSGVLAQGYTPDWAAATSRPATRATSAATSSGRVTTRPRCASSIRTRTPIASPRSTTGPRSARSTRFGLHAFYGHYAQVTDQDRFATATTARSVERADISAHDFQFRGYARRPLGPAAAGRWAST